MAAEGPLSGTNNPTRTKPDGSGGAVGEASGVIITGGAAGEGRRADGPVGATIEVGALGAVRATGGGDGEGSGARGPFSAHPASNIVASARLRNIIAGRIMAREIVENVIAKQSAERSERGSVRGH